MKEKKKKTMASFGLSSFCLECVLNLSAGLQKLGVCHSYAVPLASCGPLMVENYLV